MHISTIVPIDGKSGAIVFRNLVEETKNEAIFDLDINKFLKQHPELISQTSIKNPEVGLGDSTEPKFILPKRGLDIPLSSCIPDTRLDNIGFIDGRLHMLLKSTFGGQGYFGRFEDYDDLFFKNEGKIIKPVHKGGAGDNDGKYMYLIYEIKDVMELEDFKPYVIYPDITKGKWEIPFKMDYKYSSKKITPDILFDSKNKDNRCTIKEVTLSPMSLSIFIKGNIGDDANKQMPEIEVFFKDGSKIATPSSVTLKEEERTIINSTFAHPINIEDVAYITINNQRIKMDSPT